MLPAGVHRDEFTARTAIGWVQGGIGPGFRAVE